MRLIACILIFLTVCGCNSFPKQMTGQFNAQRGDFIVIKKDGSFFWSPPAKTEDRLRFVGIGSPDEGGSPAMTVVVPSISRVFPSVTFSPDYSHATVEWDRYDPASDPPHGQSTEFQRVRTK
jgi:hypothetical protein